MKIGLIGCGGIGIKHCMALKALSAELNIAITALADMREEYLNKAAAYWPGAVHYKMGSDLINDAGVDIVFICLPSNLHTEHALMAMEKGLDVFIEKPVCLTRDDCRRLLEAQKTYRCKVFIGHVVRFFKEYTYLKELYSSGTLGNLQSLIMTRFCGRAEDWFYQEDKSGTVVLDLHIHDTDFVRWLLGEPQDLAVTACSANNIVSHISTTYSYPDAFVTAQAIWDVSTAMPFEASYRAHFERGTLVYNSRRQPEPTLYTSDGVVQPKLQSITQGANSGLDISAIEPYYLECKYFIDCIRHDRQPETASLEDGVNSVLLALRELELAKNWINNN